MKTAKERAIQVFEKMPLGCVFFKRDIIELIEMVIKGQDRITRRYCADEVGFLFEAVDNSSINIGDIKRAIMNTKAV